MHQWIFTELHGLGQVCSWLLADGFGGKIQLEFLLVVIRNHRFVQNTDSGIVLELLTAVFGLQVEKPFHDLLEARIDLRFLFALPVHREKLVFDCIETVHSPLH